MLFWTEWSQVAHIYGPLNFSISVSSSELMLLRPEPDSFLTTGAGDLAGVGHLERFSDTFLTALVATSGVFEGHMDDFPRTILSVILRLGSNNHL